MLNRNYIWVCLVAAALFFVQCGSKPNALDLAKQEAMTAAQDCCNNIVEGNYEALLRFVDGTDSLPDAYRHQLIETHQQWAADIADDHHGLVSLNVTRADMDSTQMIMYVFAIAHFGDSLQEEVLLPMVRVGENWKLR